MTLCFLASLVEMVKRKHVCECQMTVHSMLLSLFA